MSQRQFLVLKSRHFVQQLLLSSVDSNFSAVESSFGEHFSLAELKIVFSGETVYSLVFGLLWKDVDVHIATQEFILVRCCLFSHCRLDFCSASISPSILIFVKVNVFVSCGSTIISTGKAFYLNSQNAICHYFFLHYNKKDMSRDTLKVLQQILSNHQELVTKLSTAVPN